MIVDHHCCRYRSSRLDGEIGACCRTTMIHGFPLYSSQEARVPYIKGTLGPNSLTYSAMHVGTKAVELRTPCSVARALARWQENDCGPYTLWLEQRRCHGGAMPSFCEQTGLCSSCVSILRYLPRVVQYCGPTRRKRRWLLLGSPQCFPSPLCQACSSSRQSRTDMTALFQ